MNRRDQALATFRRHGILRTKEALDLGIHRETLYRLRDEGDIEQLSRGVFKLADAPDLERPGLVTVAYRAPHAVFCLLSALALHELTTQIPHAVHIAVERGSTRPTIREVPVEVYSFHVKAFRAGISEHWIDDTPLKTYSREKTLVDVFRFRNRLGLDVFLEALDLYRRSPASSPQRVLDLAEVWRTTHEIRPYLEQAFA